METYDTLECRSDSKISLLRMRNSRCQRKQMKLPLSVFVVLVVSRQEQGKSRPRDYVSRQSSHQLPPCLDWPCNCCPSTPRIPCGVERIGLANTFRPVVISCVRRLLPSRIFLVCSHISNLRCDIYHINKDKNRIEISASVSVWRREVNLNYAEDKSEILIPSSPTQTNEVILNFSP